MVGRVFFQEGKQGQHAHQLMAQAGARLAIRKPIGSWWPKPRAIGGLGEVISWRPVRMNDSALKGCVGLTSIVPVTSNLQARSDLGQKAQLPGQLAGESSNFASMSTNSLPLAGSEGLCIVAGVILCGLLLFGLLRRKHRRG